MDAEQVNKLLIIGGNGFLGKHIQKELHNLTGYEIAVPTSKELNLLDNSNTLQYLEYSKPDVVLFAAAVCGGIGINSKRPGDFIYLNTQMGLNIFDACIRSGVKRLYTLGSVCSYPVNCPTPFREDDIWNGYPELTNSPYGIAKRHLMVMGNAYRSQFGLGGAHLIPVNLYGEEDHFDLDNSHVIPALIRKFINAVDNNLPEVYCWGTGVATREFLYAGDAAKAIVKAIDCGLDTELPINLGTGEDISIKDLAELIKELTGYNGKIIFTGEVSDGQPKRLLDVSRAKELLQFTANTDLKSGIIKTIKWYVENQSIID